MKKLLIIAMQIFFFMASLQFASDAMASDLQEASTPSEWRLVNPFRLFDPWFGTKEGELLTLMNAGKTTDKLIEPIEGNLIYAESGKESECKLGKDGCFYESRLYQCLHEAGKRLSHDCGEPFLNRYNYHDLFNWNPLSNKYSVTPKKLPIEYEYNPDMVRGDWIIEIKVKPDGALTRDCQNGRLPNGKIKVEYTSPDGSQRIGEHVSGLSECIIGREKDKGKVIIRFTLPVSVSIKCNEGDEDKKCREFKRDGKNKIKAAGEIIVDYGNTIIGRINPRDKLIVEIGDSYGSGEGNPDIAAKPISEESHPRLPPVWMDQRCHRSMYANGARAAMYLVQVLDNIDRTAHYSVTYLNFACSGAEVLSGLLQPYTGKEDPLRVVSGLINPDVDDFSTEVFSNVDKQQVINKYKKLQARFAPDRPSDYPCSSGCFNEDFYSKLIPQIDNINKLDKDDKNKIAKDDINEIAKIRDDMELLISIGGNDIGFAEIVNHLLLDGIDSNAADKKKAQDFFANGKKGKKLRESIALVSKVNSDIKHLDDLFEEWKVRIRDNGKDAPANGKDIRSVNNIYLIGYPNPTKHNDPNPTEHKAVYCNGENILGDLLLGQVKSLVYAENEFADNSIIKKLIQEQQDVLSKNYSLAYIDFSNAEHFDKHGWCSGSNKNDYITSPHQNRKSNQCLSSATEFITTDSYDAYCERPRWFRTIGDSIHTQSSHDVSFLFFDEKKDGLAISGAMHPTFEAHRYMGFFIANEIMEPAPKISPILEVITQQDVIEKIKCEPFCESEWLKEGIFTVKVTHNKHIDLGDFKCNYDGGQCPFIPETLLCKGITKKICTDQYQWQWQWNVQSLELEEGEHQIELAATYNKIKKTQRSYRVKIDRTKPRMLNSLPLDLSCSSWCRDTNIKQHLCATDQNEGKPSAIYSRVKEFHYYFLQQKGSCDDVNPGIDKIIMSPPPGEGKSEQCVDVPPPADADTYGICVKSVDNAGNVEDKYTLVDFKMDTTPPIIVIEPSVVQAGEASSQEFCAVDKASGIAELKLATSTSEVIRKCSFGNPQPSDQAYCKVKNEEGALCIKVPPSDFSCEYKIVARDSAGNEREYAMKNDARCSQSPTSEQPPPSGVLVPSETSQASSAVPTQ